MFHFSGQHSFGRYAKGGRLGVLVGLLLLASTAFLSAQEVFFEDSLDGNLQPGWKWLRENPSSHRFAHGGLEILAEPFSGNNARNGLMRPLSCLGDLFRSRNFSVETEVTCVEMPTSQYQQGGIYWFQNGEIIFKLVHEYIDGQMYIFPGKIPIDAKTVQLRIISSGDDLFAEYRLDGEGSFHRVYEGKLIRGADDEIGIQCWNGEDGDHQANSQEPWNGQRYRFSRFRILQGQ